MTDSTRMAAVDAVPAVLERLSGLCKLWGVVKYFHPYLVFRDTDWDAALVGAIPRAQAAASMQEYRDAVSALLSALDGPITRFLVGDEPEAVPQPKPGGEDEPFMDFLINEHAAYPVEVLAGLQASGRER